MKTVNSCNCPNCNYRFTGHTAIIDENLKPKPGDVSICFNCGAILEFGQGCRVTIIDIERATDILKGHSEMIEQLLFIRSAVLARYAKRN